MNLDENEPAPHLPKELALEDKWILSQFNAVVKEVTDNLCLLYTSGRFKAENSAITACRRAHNRRSGLPFGRR